VDFRPLLLRPYGSACVSVKHAAKFFKNPQENYTMIRVASPKTLRAVAALTLAAALGVCGGSTSPKPNSSAATSAAQPPANVPVPDLERAGQCLVRTLDTPTESFHLSLLRKDDDLSYPFVSEAEFTPDTLEGTTNWLSGQETRKLSNVHSDLPGWNASVMLLAGPLTSGTGMRLAQSTVASAGPDPVGGYDTIKYVFDTSILTAEEKTRFATRLKARDFRVRGSAWVTTDSKCLVKFVTDFNITALNGTLGSTHTEGSIVKQ